MDPNTHPAPSPSDQLADESMLPPRPSSVCQRCWTGPIAAYSRLLYCYASTHPLKRRLSGVEDGYIGYQDWSYTTSLRNLKKGDVAGCVWCKALLQQDFSRIRKLIDRIWGRRINIRLELRASPWGNSSGPLDQQILDTEVGSTGWLSMRHLHTAAGKFTFT